MGAQYIRPPSDISMREFAIAQEGISLFSRESYPLERNKLPDIFSDLLSFISLASTNHETPFTPGVDSKGRPVNHRTQLANRYYRKMPIFIRCVLALSDEFAYDEHTNCFISTIQELGLLNVQYFDWGEISQAHIITTPWQPNKTMAELFNDFVLKLGERCRSNDVRKKIYLHNRRSKRNFKSASHYVDSLINIYRRLVVIRLDLYYKQDIAKSVSIDRLKSDIDRLLKNAERNKVFKGMVGYLLKIEFGINRRLHTHSFFFFDADIRRGSCDEYFGKTIGEYWSKTITKNAGEYFNVNNRKNIQDMEKLGIRGIGLLRIDDKNMLNNLTNRAIYYLCKKDQFFRPKIFENTRFRTFQKGELPKRKEPIRRWQIKDTRPLTT